jgi:cytochrome oxidase Cu insertion factor (SCO1/SenC/PrrC family)
MIKDRSFKIVLAIFCLPFLFSEVVAGNKPPGYEAEVQLQFDARYAGDTIYAELYPKLIGEGDWNLEQSLLHTSYQFVLDGQGRAKMKISMPKQFAYLSLARDIDGKFGGKNPLIDFYLLESGDSIAVNVSSDSIYSPRFYSEDPRVKPKYRLDFAGTGAEKFQFFYEWRHPVGGKHRTGESVAFVPVFDSLGRYNEGNHLFHDFLADSTRLEHLMADMDAESREICRADLVGEYFRFLGRNESTAKHNYPQVDFAYDEFRNELWKRGGTLSENAKVQSKYYSDGVYELERTAFMLKNRDLNSGFYAELRDGYSGMLRDHLLTLFFSQSIDNMGNIGQMVHNAQSVMESERLKRIILKCTNKLPGIPAFNFSLPNMDGKMVSLEKLKGKYVFIDFYFTGCSDCSYFYTHTLRPIEEKYKGDKRVCFISISIDANKKEWLSSLTSGRYSTTGQANVLNLYTGGKGINSPLIKNYDVFAYPEHMFIDPEGKIVEFDKDQFRQNNELEKLISAAVRGSKVYLNSGGL